MYRRLRELREDRDLTQSQISISSENLYYYITHNALCQVFLIIISHFVFKM